MLTESEKLELIQMLTKDTVDHVEVVRYVDEIVKETATEQYGEGYDAGYDEGWGAGEDYARSRAEELMA